MCQYYFGYECFFSLITVKCGANAHLVFDRINRGGETNHVWWKDVWRIKSNQWTFCVVCWKQRKKKYTISPPRPRKQINSFEVQWMWTFMRLMLWKFHRFYFSTEVKKWTKSSNKIWQHKKIVKISRYQCSIFFCSQRIHFKAHRLASDIVTAPLVLSSTTQFDSNSNSGATNQKEFQSYLDEYHYPFVISTSGFHEWSIYRTGRFFFLYTPI